MEGVDGGVGMFGEGWDFGGILNLELREGGERGGGPVGGGGSIFWEGVTSMSEFEGIAEALDVASDEEGCFAGLC